MQAVVAYYRVSTDKQGRNGLGIEAQRAAIAHFVKAEGMELIAEHTEVETGKGADALDRRPVLRDALAQAKRAKAAVCVAKLDRLSRDVHFISGLMTHKVPFIVTEHRKLSRLSCISAQPSLRKSAERSLTGPVRAGAEEGARRATREPHQSRRCAAGRAGQEPPGRRRLRCERAADRAPDTGRRCYRPGEHRAGIERSRRAHRVRRRLARFNRAQSAGACAAVMAELRNENGGIFSHRVGGWYSASGTCRQSRHFGDTVWQMHGDYGNGRCHGSVALLEQSCKCRISERPTWFRIHFAAQG